MRITELIEHGRSRDDMGFRNEDKLHKAYEKGYREGYEDALCEVEEAMGQRNNADTSMSNRMGNRSSGGSRSGMGYREDSDFNSLRERMRRH